MKLSMELKPWQQSHKYLFVELNPFSFTGYRYQQRPLKLLGKMETCNDDVLCQAVEAFRPTQALCKPQYLDQVFNEKPIEVSHQYIRFSYDQPSNRVAVLRVFNKTKKYIRIDLIPPQSNIFIIYYDQKDLYAGSSIPIYVRCTPQDNQIALDSIEVQADNPCCSIRVPLELLPSVEWFQIPKYVTLPAATIDRQVEGTVRLPQPPKNRVFGFMITSPHIGIFNVEPKKGYIGGANSVECLKVTFLAHEYLTLTYKLQIKFTGTPCSQHYEVYVTGRCLPNLENESIRRDVHNIEKLKEDWQKGHTVKKPGPRQKLVVKLKALPYEHGYDASSDLSTPAGMMKFLLSKESQALGPLGMDKAKAQSLYFRKRAEFMQEVEARKIKQKALQFQPSRVHTGEESADSNSEYMKKLYHERERQWQDYMAATGESTMISEDFMRTSTQESNVRLIINVGDSNNTSRNQGDFPVIKNQEFKAQFDTVKKFILRPFIQAAYKIMLKYRVKRRLKHIRTLTESLKTQRDHESQELWQAAQSARLQSKPASHC